MVSPITMGKFSSLVQKKQGFFLSSRTDITRMQELLGDGPMRFAPKELERTIQEQFDGLTDQELACVEALLDKWDSKCPGDPLPDHIVLRYARNSPGEEAFQLNAAWNSLKRQLAGSRRTSTIRHLGLNARDIQKQLETKSLFPLPGLKTKSGHDVFYMKPSRYSPSSMPTSTIIDNLAYCMNTMYEKESTNIAGVAFLANMDDWTMNHFGTNYCLKFMNMLQGKTLPVRVNLFLIVNPRPWFHKVWSIMKPMLTEEFAKKVHMITESELSEHLETGYEAFLPDEMASGKADTDALVFDFVKYRIFLETGVIPVTAYPASPRKSPFKKRVGSPEKKRRGLLSLFKQRNTHTGISYAIEQPC